MALSDRDRAILDFEREWLIETGAKNPAIRTRLGLSASTYYRMLNRVLDLDEAAEYEPLVVRRLRRDRERRRRARFEGRSSAGEPTR